MNVEILEPSPPAQLEQIEEEKIPKSEKDNCNSSFAMSGKSPQFGKEESKLSIPRIYEIRNSLSQSSNNHW